MCLWLHDSSLLGDTKEHCVGIDNASTSSTVGTGREGNTWLYAVAHQCIKSGAVVPAGRSFRSKFCGYVAAQVLSDNSL